MTCSLFRFWFCRRIKETRYSRVLSVFGCVLTTDALCLSLFSFTSVASAAAQEGDLVASILPDDDGKRRTRSRRRMFTKEKATSLEGKDNRQTCRANSTREGHEGQGRRTPWKKVYISGCSNSTIESRCYMTTNLRGRVEQMRFSKTKTRCKE